MRTVLDLQECPFRKKRMCKFVSRCMKKCERNAVSVHLNMVMCVRVGVNMYNLLFCCGV